MALHFIIEEKKFLREFKLIFAEMLQCLKKSAPSSQPLLSDLFYDALALVTHKEDERV